MKQSIQLRLGQHLTMTPQLQQAIRLLQLSTLELQMEVQQALESNLMLETEEEALEQAADRRNGSDGQGSSTSATGESELNRGQDSIPDDLPVDSVWEDVYDLGTVGYGSLGDYEDRETDLPDSGGEGLRDHLLWQTRMSQFCDADLAIAATIIDSINDDGYLTCALEEIQQAVAGYFEVDLDEVQAVLHRLQNFDPPGVACRNLGECLYQQLRQLEPSTPWREQAMQIVNEHLELLAASDQQQLMRLTRLDEEQLRQVATLIRTLNPRPGNALPGPAPEYIIPDVIVRKTNGAWRVELNLEATPKLRINRRYAGMIRRADNSSDNTTLKSHLQEARWFIKSLQSRNETLLKVATAIVERQKGFLEFGEEAMKPMVLRDVAEAIDMHESTVSRVTTRKYMHTPRGIYEFKFFFSSHVSTESGGECSATAIRALMKKLVAAENPSKPLSDHKIADILSEQGINVARRTVAKYREALSIPPSNERKRLI